MKTIEEMELLREQVAEVLYKDVMRAQKKKHIPWRHASPAMRASFERLVAVVFDFLFKQHPLDIINIFVEDPVAKIICDQLSIVVQGTKKAAAIQELNEKSTQND